MARPHHYGLGNIRSFDDCMVVSPSMTPRKASDPVRWLSDRSSTWTVRNALSLRRAVRLVELKHRFQQLLYRCSCCLSSNWIVTEMRAMHDASVLVGERLVGSKIDKKPIGILLDSAIAR